MTGVQTCALPILIASFLTKEFSKEQIEEYLGEIGFIKPKSKKYKPIKIDTLSLEERIEIVCEKINTDFEQHQKVWLALQLVEFVGDSGYVSEEKLHFIQSIAKEFNIPDDEFTNGKDFILASTPGDIPKNFNIILVDGDERSNRSEERRVG